MPSGRKTEHTVCPIRLLLFFFFANHKEQLFAVFVPRNKSIFRIREIRFFARQSHATVIKSGKNFFLKTDNEVFFRSPFFHLVSIIIIFFFCRSLANRAPLRVGPGWFCFSFPFAPPKGGGMVVRRRRSGYLCTRTNVALLVSSDKSLLLYYCRRREQTAPANNGKRLYLRVMYNIIMYNKHQPVR